MKRHFNWLLPALVFLVHLGVGVWYATRSERFEQRPTLGQVGEEFLRAFPGWDVVEEHDAAAYNRAAVTARHTGVPRTRSGAVFWHAPLYAYFLAGCYWLGGIRLWSVAIPQAALLAGVAWLLARAAQRVAGNRPIAGWLAAGLILVNLRLAIYVGLMSSPAILVAFWMALAIEALGAPLTHRRSLALAAVLGAACYTQAGMFVIALAAAGWLAWWGRRHPGGGARTAAAVIAVLALAKPVLVLAEPTDPLALSDREILWEANNPYYESMTWTSAWERRPGNPWTRWQASATETARFAEYEARSRRTGTSPAWLWVRENPGHYAKLCWIRLRTTLGPHTGQMSPRNRWFALGWWLVVAPAGVWGWWRGRRTGLGQFAAVTWAGLLVMSGLVIMDWYLRYRIPGELVLVPFAAAVYAGAKQGADEPNHA